MEKFWVDFVVHFAVEYLLELGFVLFLHSEHGWEELFGLGCAWQFGDAALLGGQENLEAVLGGEEEVGNADF